MKDFRDVIIRPIITEKSMKLMADDNKITVEAIWNVKVEKVNMLNVKPRTKRVGRYTGKTHAVHKAIVKLAEGSTIDLFGEAE